MRRSKSKKRKSKRRSKSKRRKSKRKSPKRRSRRKKKIPNIWKLKNVTVIVNRKKADDSQVSLEYDDLSYYYEHKGEKVRDSFTLSDEKLRKKLHLKLRGNVLSYNFINRFTKQKMFVKIVFGDKWLVKIIKEKMNDSTLFVIYDPDINWGKCEEPPKLKYAKGWLPVGSGGSEAILYPKEEQFSGPIQHRAKMKQYVKKHYNELKAKKMVKRYKIGTNYSDLMYILKKRPIYHGRRKK